MLFEAIKREKTTLFLQRFCSSVIAICLPDHFSVKCTAIASAVSCFFSALLDRRLSFPSCSLDAFDLAAEAACIFTLSSGLIILTDGDDDVGFEVDFMNFGVLVFSKATVEEKDLALASEAVSSSVYFSNFVDSMFLGSSFGDEGRKIVGYLSPGKRDCGKLGIPPPILML